MRDFLVLCVLLLFQKAQIIMSAEKITKGERTRERLLDQAESLFAEKGYAATNLREIARQSGMHVPGLYFYFENKDELYKAVLKRALQPIQDALDNVLSGDADTLLEELPVIMIDYLVEKPQIIYLFQHALLNSDNAGATLTRRWLDTFFDKGIEILTKQDSALGKKRARLKILALYNVVSGFFLFGNEVNIANQKKGDGGQNLKLQKELVMDLVAHFT